MAFGDTFGIRGVPAAQELAANVLFRSADADLANGMTVTDGQSRFTGSDFRRIAADLRSPECAV